MTAIDFSALPMKKRDFVLHFRAKIENTKWMSRLFEYSQNGQNIHASRPKTLKELKPIVEAFEGFPYEWAVTKSKVQISHFTPIAEAHTEFDESKASYIISVPFHHGSVKEVTKIIRSIEDESFAETKVHSQTLAKKRVAIVMGLNNCKSFNLGRTDTFRNQVAKLRATTLTRVVSLTILPFFWGYPWVQKKVSRYIFSVHQCYRIANSYFRSFRGSNDSLWFSSFFNQQGNPSEKTIPYQSIRDQILHSLPLRTYFKSSHSELKYIVSLDGDFLSLKSVDSSIGLLSHYSTLIQKHHEETGLYPDVLSTGYEPPQEEENELIKLGIILDRSIRAVIPAKFVYMPEPNFAFRISDIKDLGRLSWMGSATMDTESRRLIANGLTRGIFDSEQFIYSNEGGIQTAIDSAWRTATVNKHQAVDASKLKQKGVQKAMRGIRQSYADPQIWATNVYNGLPVSVTEYMKECITPMKGIRELFDPITLRKDRFGADRTHASDFETLFRIFPIYITHMENSITDDDFDTLVASFIEEIDVKGKTLRQGWENFMKDQMNKFQEYRDLLEVNYTEEQIDEVIQAALATGQAIKEFYAERIIPPEA